MSGPQPNTDQRLDLASRLSSLICCPSDETGCEDSDFCLGIEERPEGSKYQNSERFCGWFVQSGCYQLSKDIQDFAAGAPQCSVLSEDQRKKIIRSLTGGEFSSADIDPQEQACRQVMIDHEQGSGIQAGDQCEGMSVADLNGVAAFCDAAASVTPSSPPPPPGGTSWPQDIVDFIKENGAAVIAIISAVTTFLVALKAAAVKFRTSIINLAKTIPKWMNVWKLFTAPRLNLDRDVVASQLRGLSSNEKFKTEGDLFAELEPVVQEFTAQQAINEWNALWRVTQNVYLYLVKDSGTISTGLPDGFIEGFAKKFLKAHKVEALKTAALNWARTEQPRDQPVPEEDPPEDKSDIRRRLRQTSPELRPVVPSVDPIRGRPILRVVLKQLEMLKDDTTYAPHGSLFTVQKGYVQFYLAELAMNRWHALSSEERGEYLKNDTLPLRGALPYDFVRWFATKYLKEEIIERVHTSAAEWAKDAARKMGGEIVPIVDNVRNQIVLSGLFYKNTAAAYYAAEIAIEIWSKLDDEQRGKFVDITHPIAGGDLPQKFIDTIEKRVDPRAIAFKLSLKIAPNLETVTEQIIRDTRFSATTSQFLARIAIDRWMQFDETGRANFVEPARPLQSGELPWMFLRWFKRSTNLRDASKLLGVYEYLRTNRRDIEDFNVSIIYDRLIQIYAAWKGLPPAIKKEFEEQGHDLVMPTTFLELMRTSLRVSTRPRVRLQAATEPWEYDARATPIMYEDINLSLVMRTLVQKNSGFSRYPSVLEARAKALVDDWKNLPDNIRTAFKVQDTKNGTANGGTDIPVTFVKVWSGINGGIGVAGRTSLEPDDDPDKNRGGGGSAGGAGGSTNISGFVPSGEISGTSGVSGASSRSMLPVPAPVIAGGMSVMQPVVNWVTAFTMRAPYLGILNYAAVPAGL